MKTLAATAMAITLFFAGFTVYFALQSDSLDGEPFATVEIEHPPKVAGTRAVVVEKADERLATAAPDETNASSSEPMETAANTIDQTPPSDARAIGIQENAAAPDQPTPALPSGIAAMQTGVGIGDIGFGSIPTKKQKQPVN